MLPARENFGLRIHLISDLHLNLAEPRSMAFFGSHWEDHTSRLATAWDKTVGPSDLVLIPGDISWASTPTRMDPDLAWLAERPGRKVYSQGNHDRWWRTPARLSQVLPPQDHHVHDCWRPFYGGLIAGLIGGTCPGDRFFDERWERKWPKVLESASALLDALPKARKRHGAQFAILMLHYPPYNGYGVASALATAIEESAVTLCVSGHFHRPEEWENTWNGVRNETTYAFGACDALSFVPTPLGEIRDGRLLLETTSALLPPPGAPV